MSATDPRVSSIVRELRRLSPEMCLRVQEECQRLLARKGCELWTITRVESTTVTERWDQHYWRVVGSCGGEPRFAIFSQMSGYGVIEVGRFLQACGFYTGLQRSLEHFDAYSQAGGVIEVGQFLQACGHDPAGGERLRRVLEKAAGKVVWAQQIVGKDGRKLERWRFFAAYPEPTPPEAPTTEITAALAPNVS